MPKHSSLRLSAAKRRVSLRPRGFAPPRRFVPSHSLRACCIPLPTWGSLRFRLRRPTTHPKVDMAPTGAFPATLLTPLEGFPSPAAAPRHRGRCPPDVTVRRPEALRDLSAATPRRRDMWTGRRTRPLDQSPPASLHVTVEPDIRRSGASDRTRCRRRPKPTRTPVEDHHTERRSPSPKRRVVRSCHPLPDTEVSAEVRLPLPEGRGAGTCKPFPGDEDAASNAFVWLVISCEGLPKPPSRQSCVDPHRSVSRRLPFSSARCTPQ
jgi:hypothetical protein